MPQQCRHVKLTPPLSPGETQDSQEFSPSCSKRSYVPLPNCFSSRYDLYPEVFIPSALYVQWIYLYPSWMHIVTSQVMFFLSPTVCPQSPIMWPAQRQPPSRDLIAPWPSTPPGRSHGKDGGARRKRKRRGGRNKDGDVECLLGSLSRRAAALQSRSR